MVEIDLIYIRNVTVVYIRNTIVATNKHFFQIPYYCTGIQLNLYTWYQVQTSKFIWQSQLGDMVEHKDMSQKVISSETIKYSTHVGGYI